MLTGAGLERMDDGLATRAAAVNVSMRMVPEQKLRLVRGGTARGEVLAMTGNGVNDVPALEAAPIGFTMGARDERQGQKGDADVIAIHVLIGGLAGLLLAGAAQATPAGQTLYRRYCASCHGLEGRGDGPAAPALRPPPSDLTKVETSLPELMQQIDGRRTILAHGTSAMPVWGEVFEEKSISEPHRRRTALHQLQELAAHVRSLRSASSEKR